MARQLGITRTQLSGLENDLNQEPSESAVQRIASTLQLTPDQVAELENAAKRSRRRYLVPVNAAPAVFDLIYELMERSERLTNRDALFLREALLLLDKGPGEKPKPRRIYRKDKSTSRATGDKEEAKM
jgi:transcriptional regulator with XRE-family HTH domain